MPGRNARPKWAHAEERRRRAAGPFGAVLPLDEALAFIADEPAFWIRAEPPDPVMWEKSRAIGYGGRYGAATQDDAAQERSVSRRVPVIAL